MKQIIAQPDSLAKLNESISRFVNSSRDCDRIEYGQNVIHKTNLNSQSRHGWLSLGFPGRHKLPIRKDCFFWFPLGIPEGESLFVASSKLGRSPEKHKDWFNAFRTLTCRVNPNQQYLVTAKGTTADRFVKRAGQLFNLNLVEFHFLPADPLEDGFNVQLKSHQANKFPCYVIPTAKVKTIAWDQFLMDIANEVRVLSVRSGGKVEQAVLERCRTREQTNVFLLNSSSKTTTNTVSKLTDAGCHPWLLLHDESSNVSEPTIAKEFRIPIVNELPGGEFLIHCTRPRIGPWPTQDENQFLDDLIFQDQRAEHSASAALSRILATGYLWGTSELIRAKRKVVCFTDVGLKNLSRLKTYRSHLGRWDFLPVGIAIRKSALISLGAKPVIYGDDETWKSLEEFEQPLFQVARTETKSGNVIDWTVEQEWRYQGDLDLRHFSPGDIFAIHQEDIC